MLQILLQQDKVVPHMAFLTDLTQNYLESVLEDDEHDYIDIDNLSLKINNFKVKVNEEVEGLFNTLGLRYWYDDAIIEPERSALLYEKYGFIMKHDCIHVNIPSF